MRKLILIWAALALPLFADIDEIGGIATSTLDLTGYSEIGGQTIASAGGGCSTAQDSEENTGTSQGNVGSHSFYQYRAGNIDTTSAYTVCKVELSLKSVGSPTQDLTVSIYDDSSGEPGSLVGTASDAVDASTIGSTFEWVEFTGISAVLSDATTYWVVIHADAADSGNYVHWEYTNGGDASDRLAYDANGVGPWSSDGSNLPFRLRLYSN